MGDSPSSFEEIVAYILGELSQSEADKVRASLEASGEAMATLDRVRRMLDVMRTDDSMTPARSLVDRAKELVPARGAMAAWWTRAAECVAALVFDSRAQVAVAGFRGGSIGRQLAFSCELGEIDLSVVDGPDGAWTIRGQFDAPPGCSAGAVAVFEPGASEPVSEGRIDDSGQFKLQCPTPICELRILVGDRLVAAGPLHLE